MRGAPENAARVAAIATHCLAKFFGQRLKHVRRRRICRGVLAVQSLEVEKAISLIGSLEALSLSRGR
jgi:hypothetical protein